MARRRRHTPEQIIRKSREAERLQAQGATIPEVAKQLEISEQTFHRWRNQFGGMKADDAKRLKELERENARLKRIVADQALDIDALREVAKETFEPGTSARCGRDAPGPVRHVAAARVSGCRPAPIDPALSTVPAGSGCRAALLAARVLPAAAALGYRRAHVEARAAGYAVNRKKIQRLWRAQGLRVPTHRRKRQRLGTSTVPADRRSAERPNQVSAADFQFDNTADGRGVQDPQSGR